MDENSKESEESDDHMDDELLNPAKKGFGLDG